MELTKESEYGNKLLMDSIKDEDYKQEVIGNGYCVGLLEYEVGVTTEEVGIMGVNQIACQKLKVTEYLGGYKHTWTGEEELWIAENNRDSHTIIELKLTKSLKLDKHTINEIAMTSIKVRISDNLNGQEKIDVILSARYKAINSVTYTNYTKYHTKDIEYYSIPIKLGAVTWSCLNTGDGTTDEFWMRKDREANRGEIYLEIDKDLKNIITSNGEYLEAELTTNKETKYGNKLLMDSIKDEDYKRLVEKTGYCIGLIEGGEVIQNEYRTWHKVSKFKITDYFKSQEHVWEGKLEEESNNSVYKKASLKLRENPDSDDYSLKGYFKELDDEIDTYVKGKLRKNLRLKNTSCGLSVEDINITLYTYRNENYMNVRINTDFGLSFPAFTYERRHKVLDGITWYRFYNGTRKDDGHIDKQIDGMWGHSNGRSVYISDVTREDDGYIDKHIDGHLNGMWVRINDVTKQGEIYIEISDKLRAKFAILGVFLK